MVRVLTVFVTQDGRVSHAIKVSTIKQAVKHRIPKDDVILGIVVKMLFSISFKFYSFVCLRVRIYMCCILCISAMN